MPSIKCKIGGKEYNLDYERTPITSGILYHGTLFQHKILEFFFVNFNNGEPPLFSPLHTDEALKNEIITCVNAHESSAK